METKTKRIIFLIIAIIFASILFASSYLLKDDGLVMPQISQQTKTNENEQLKKDNQLQKQNNNEIEINNKEETGDFLSSIAKTFSVSSSDEDFKRIQIPQEIIDKAKQSLNENDFYYKNLSEDLKQLYVDLYCIITNYNSNYYIHTTDYDTIDNVITCVIFDHPEIYYVSGYTTIEYYGEDNNIAYMSLSATYTMSEQDIQMYQNTIDTYSQEFMEAFCDEFNVTKDTINQVSEYNRSKFTYEYIIYNTSYDKEALFNQDIISIMRFGKTVCTGYAKTYKYLLNKLGIESIVVEGYASSTGTFSADNLHAWNITYIDGQAYHDDATWGDYSYQYVYLNEDGDADESLGSFTKEGLTYDYLNITDDDMSSTHKLIRLVDNMPICNSRDANFYKNDGNYIEEIDDDQIYDIVCDEIDYGSSQIVLKCKDRSTYNQLVNYLITDGHIEDFIDFGGIPFSYTLGDELCKLVIYLD